ncbi:hypothetical protein F5X71_27025 [Nocardia brasiliensis]|uniref:Uncharacterized protein n=1 Tax=Nocardia brasiliensis TaxID=37326 RepID=A0A6G9XX44_NOCBR|nr:hypothetical protein [Nocardia brasiliensis]QIS05478.1 hypothetical protein F5X71_27025 [Nocardia brasiliensis]
MMKDVAAPGGGEVALVVARCADGVATEWNRGRRRWQIMWSRRGEPARRDVPRPATSEELWEGVDPFMAVRWQGVR